MRHPLLAAAALGLLAALGAGRALAQSPPATLVEAAGDAVVFNGRIDARSAEEFLRLLQDPQVKRLVITSRGGSVPAALDMAKALHERGLDVEVPSACWSSCANYIFVAARRKTIGRPGAVAWHGNMTHVLYLQQTGQGNWNEQQMESARQLARREAEFFRRIGVDGFLGWFGKIEPYQADEFYSVSAQDMERFGVRQVTVREEPTAQARSADVRHIEVDWAGLEAARPFVRLEP